MGDMNNTHTILIGKLERKQIT